MSDDEQNVKQNGPCRCCCAPSSLLQQKSGVVLLSASWAGPNTFDDKCERFFAIIMYFNDGDETGTTAIKLGAAAERMCVTKMMLRTNHALYLFKACIA